MSPKDAPRGGRFSGTFTPGRIAVIALLIVTLVFIFQNTRYVKVRLLVPEVTMPLYLALLATAAIGALCGGYLMGRRK